MAKIILMVILILLTPFDIYADTIKDNLTCANIIDPNTRDVETVYYRGDRVVATQKADDAGNIVTTGTIPDGIVREEQPEGPGYVEWQYRNGERNGISKVYSAPGKLEREILYTNGKVVKQSTDEAPVKSRRPDIPIDNINIVFDLNKGEVNGLNLEGHVDSEILIKSIGEKPDIEEAGFVPDYKYKYYKRGFLVTLDTKKSTTNLVSIYLSDIESIYDDDYYLSFKGKIVPLVANENMKTIKEKFGGSYKDITVQANETQWQYEKPYGRLNFNFDENGNLKTVTMFFQYWGKNR